MLSFKKLLGEDVGAKELKSIKPIIEKVNSYEASTSSLSDSELLAKTDEFKERISKGEALDDLLPEAFATVREAAKRTLNERHFDVQIMGGVALHNGSISEMRTGEGKTLVATLPAYLNALLGKGVHIVTVNDYLSRRDAVWMGQVYAALGLTTAVINSGNSYLYDKGHTDKDEERDEKGSFKIVYDFLRPCSRRDAYKADITYGTNSEFGFDYLRDNIEYKEEELRQREPYYAIVDEIDSILIDEARTPLIISAPSEDSGSLYATFANVALQLKEGEHYTIDEKHRQIAMTDEGIEKTEDILGLENIYTERGIKYVHHLETAVRAKALFQNDKEYVVRGEEIIIVDEFTGRLQPGRRWSEGLHQAIEAKEGVPLQKESRTFASVTYQNYFRTYEKLAGMTGTANTSSEEFFKVYGLNVVEVPTNREVKRKDNEDLIFQTEEGKFKAIARRVKELNKKGQPVLIGTVSIEKNELLSAHLTKEGVKHEVLNAKKHEQEGEIVAQAGVAGKVTIATNMAGRGVDIKLGGATATKKEYEDVKALGGLFVLGTERHEARRIDNQLRGRSGRQGDPGETEFFVSLEDSLMRVFASDVIKKMMGRFGIPEDEPIENSLISKSLESAQTKIEGFHFDSRKAVLSFDDVMDQQRKVIYKRRQKILVGSNEDVENVLAEVLKEDNGEAGEVVESKKEELGDEFYNVLRRLMLQTSDMLWVEHLETMDYLRSSVNLRAYGQRDPLVEYKKEGLRLFKDLEFSFNIQLVHAIPNMVSGVFKEEKNKKLDEVHESAKSITEVTKVAKQRSKIGRNDIVKITDGNVIKEMKYKKAKPLIESEKWKFSD
ncbi:MAG: preprotein translocase subunit SecA [Candidatus Pacebacteria bacterium]|jgi:preprotein translocase subunit SecA|nr:preprotein translocase subunit SecA [Candidatus Paceibacterota bacterium]|tara:strand:- start:800 stop:3304 length:2505 start_codon:yes stop_codon:yes gene_type:complete